MKKLESTLCILLLAVAILNLFAIPLMTSLLVLGCCTLSFVYLLIGIISIGRLGVNLIVTRPIGNIREEPSDAIFPQIQDDNGSFFQPVGWKQKLGTLLIAYCFAIMVLAILFRISYWPKSSILLSIGLLQLVIVLVVLIIKQLTKPSKFSRQALIRTVIYFLIGITLYTLPESFIVDFKYRNNPEKLQQVKEHHLIQQSR